MYTDVFRKFAVVAEFNAFMNMAVKRFPAGSINTRVLEVRGDVCDDEDLGIARLTVEVTAGEQERIAVQVVQHVAMLQSASEFLENQHILATIGVEGVTVVRNTAAIGVAVAVHDGAGFAGTCLAENVGDGEITPGVGELSVTEGGEAALGGSEVDEQVRMRRFLIRSDCGKRCLFRPC